jgi:hypothetical protein
MRVVSGILAAAVVATAFVVPTEPAAAQAVESVDGQELAFAVRSSIAPILETGARRSSSR